MTIRTTKSLNNPQKIQLYINFLKLSDLKAVQTTPYEI